MRRFGLAAVALALLVAACTDGDAPPAATDPSPTGTGAAPTTPAGPGPDATGPAPASPTPTASGPQPFVAAQVVAGDQHACAVDADGQAWCWGYNRFGQLGDGTTTDRPTPVAVAGDTRFTSLAAGRYFTCGLTDAGQALCWGDNSRGQLGDGTTGAGSDDRNRSSPGAVLGDLTFVTVVTGQLHACGLTEPGEAYCWGSYPSGQLGTAVSEDQTAPVRSAEGLTFAALAPGGDTHTCGLTAEGAAWCWGSNNAGQLGDGTKTNAAQPEPRQVTAPQPFTALALGHAHTCGLGEGGAVWCWGANSSGQLGDGTTTERLVPTRVDSSLRFTALTAGDSHTCAVTADGEGHCWGNNSFGRLGTGDSGGMSASPAAVAGGIAFATLSAGEEFTCGTATDGTALCWGSNRSGWLGTGTDARSAEPVPVAAP